MLINVIGVRFRYVLDLYNEMIDLNDIIQSSNNSLCLISDVNFFITGPIVCSDGVIPAP